MRILIGTPYYRTVHTQFVTSLLQMILASASFAQCSHVFVQGTNASRQRNLLCTQAVEGEFDYLMTIDSDMLFTTDTLESFLGVGGLVVGGLYTGRLEDNKQRLMVFKEDAVRPEGKFIHFNGLGDLPSTTEPFKVVGVGSGVMLISVTLLKELLKPEIKGQIGLPFSFWQLPDGKNPLGPDLSFCHRMNLLGVEMWMDPRPEIGHIYDGVMYPKMLTGMKYGGSKYGKTK